MSCATQQGNCVVEMHSLKISYTLWKVLVCRADDQIYFANGLWHFVKLVSVNTGSIAGNNNHMEEARRKARPTMYPLASCGFRFRLRAVGQCQLCQADRVTGIVTAWAKSSFCCVLFKCMQYIEVLSLDFNCTCSSADVRSNSVSWTMNLFAWHASVRKFAVIQFAERDTWSNSC